MLSHDVGFEILQDKDQVIIRGLYYGEESHKLEELTTALATIGNELTIRGLCESHLTANVQNCDGTWIYEEVLLRNCDEDTMAKTIDEYKAKRLYKFLPLARTS